MHTDENNDGVCDFCSKPMPMFIKVTDEKDIVYGGTYIFVAEIGGKYYALKAPPEDGKTGERQYRNIMGVAEIIPGTNGEFAFNTLVAAEAVMLKTEFAAECGPLDAGKPRYGLSTVFENTRTCGRLQCLQYVSQRTCKIWLPHCAGTKQDRKNCFCL